MTALSDFKDGKWKKQIAKTITSLSGMIFQGKEQSKIDSLESDKLVHLKDVESAYISLGRKVFQNINENKEIDKEVYDIVEKIKIKYVSIKNLDKELMELKRNIVNQTILQEKEEVEKAYEREKTKLKEALDMELITEEEYEQKTKERKKYIDKFDDIRKIKKQYDMNLITKEEMDRKLDDILS